MRQHTHTDDDINLVNCMFFGLSLAYDFSHNMHFWPIFVNDIPLEITDRTTQNWQLN